MPRERVHIPPNGKAEKSSTQFIADWKGICDRSQEGNSLNKGPLNNRILKGGGDSPNLP